MKLTKRILMAIVATISSIGLATANCNIHLMVAPVEQGTEIPDEVNEMLMTRLTTAITATGVTASPNFDRFFITGKISHLYKEVVAGPPMSNVMHSTLTLYIGDYISQKVYATSVYELRGVGTSETRAFVNAFRQLNGKNQQLQNFVEQGSEKIIDYYNREYPIILKQAKNAASLKNYEEALSLATSIPECCQGWPEAEKMIISTYNKYIDYVGRILISQARAAWAASPDDTGAYEAYSYLTQIDPDAACYKDAMALHNEMKKVVKENWDFENKTKYKNEIDLERRKIEAARAVGVAFGKGQKETTTNLMWLD
jgi:hypothetical protein